MLFKNISIIDESFNCRENMFVGVENGRIAYIGSEAPQKDYGQGYDGSGKLLMPALYNAHTHNAMTLMRGYAENVVLDVWLNEHIFPFEAKLDGESIYNGAMLAAAEMLRFGTVGATDMYFNAEANARAVADSGIKMNMALPMTCFDGRSLKELEIYRGILENVPKYNGSLAGRLKTDLAIHAEYTSTERVVREMAELSKDLGLNMHLHLSETRAEHEACKERRGGRTPARYFYDLGVFDVPTTAAHCVWVEDEDIELMREKGVTAASCPMSNIKLASGFCRAKKLIDAGVNYALGTDGVASNNNLNLFEELKLCATLFKGVTGDPTAISPRQALYAATRAGALSQGRADCGLVKEGFKADLTVIDLRNKPHMHPCYDMLNNVVFSAQGSDVCLTMADGRVLYKDGEYLTMDIERVIFEARRSAMNIASKL